ncbi:hypothetical protein DIC75_06090 [Methanoculleus sp. CWC-02]|uniref:DUF4352 domain-containing protein n=2 Tax=Methanoculleus oceani TaxID=2184756 RepID=A0ABD4TG36_9EURY|nr:hypothetical protein [Methanoculleus sp. CWC-02]
MHMNKHHENALILFGIAVCAGFLLSVPPVAGSGQGLMALGSGELLPFSLANLSVAENGSEPSGTPILPDMRSISDAVPALTDGENISIAFPVLLDDRDTSGAVPELADEGNTSDTVPELADEGNASDAFPVLPDDRDTPDAFPAPTDPGVPGADTEPVMPAGPENAGQPVIPIPAVDASSNETGSYNDERLAGLINTASIRLMRLSMEHAYALYLQDADVAAVAADDLHAFSVRVLREVQPLQVSPGQQPVKDEFIRSLEAYSTASETLLGPTDAGGDSVPTAFRDLATASEGLETVTRQAGELQSTGARTPPVSTAATTLATGAPGVSAGTGPVVVAPPNEVLPLLYRYTYDDPSGENMVSLLAESTRTATVYYDVPVNASTARVEAGEGRMFLLVVVKSTNLGHRGDSELYAIETPGRDAFVLEYQGSTFEPLDVPPFTSLGESFDRKTLERYESLKGYLYFDVPATLEISGATLRADLGDAGMPAWELGKELGEELDDAAAV